MALRHSTKHKNMTINLPNPWPVRVSRLVILAAVLGHYFSRLISPIVLPLGPAEPLPRHERPLISAIDYSNNELTFKYGTLKKIYERLSEGQDPLIKGPETVVFSNDGTMYVMSETSTLIKLTHFEEQDDGITILANAQEIIDLGIGRPLGATFDSNGNLYVADAVQGLLRVRYPVNERSKVELVASRFLVDGKWSNINYADDVSVGRSGKVYFSDATDIHPDMYHGKWDVLYASKLDLVRGGKGRGRLLEYDPHTDVVRVLVDGIHFANGVAVSQDEDFVIVSETFRARTLKYYLDGPKKGILEHLSPSFPSFSDGVDCNPTSGLCYVALPSPPPLIMRLVNKIPHPHDRYVRTLLMTLPRFISPSPQRIGGIAEINPGNSIDEQSLVRLLLDPTGRDVSFITGSTVHENKLYLASIHSNFIGQYDLR